ncbi:MAG: hypothetical protein DMF59_17420 [Acidobacteria bacterium]|nr:MAG: hypothetical protein DMF59_17420 [Acidobacteriota bacterium]
MFNEARIGYQTIREHRTTPVIFPSIEIGGANQNATLNTGTERFSGANALDQKITELTDDFTLVRGNHQFVFGTHNEIFKFKNLFLSEFYGYYFFPTVAAFEQGAQPTEYRISFATGSNPRAPVAFKASQYGLYGSDTWHMNNNLSLIFGLRADPGLQPARRDRAAGLQHLIQAEEHDRLVASTRLQLEPADGRQPAGSRRHRRLLRPRAVRLDFQRLRRNRSRDGGAGVHGRHELHTAGIQS